MSETLSKFIDTISKLPTRVGSIVQGQCEFLHLFFNEHPEIKNVLETGFHVGLSAAVMMDVRSDISVLSFDIFWFDYTRRAKLLLDIAYPGRNILVAGNSIISIPTYLKMNPSYTPDFVFIDGGHERPIPFIDMYILFNAIPKGTWVMIDDYCDAHGMQGVIEAVNIFMNDSILEDIKIYKSGDRGWVIGKRSAVPLTRSEDAENPEFILKLLHDTESHYPA